MPPSTREFLERLDHPDMTRERLVQAFLEPPVFSHAFSRGFGTIYTAAYYPAEDRAEYRWPGFTWSQSFQDFVAGEQTQAFAERVRAA